MKAKQKDSDHFKSETSEEIDVNLEVKFLSRIEAQELQDKARKEYKLAFEILKDM